MPSRLLALLVTGFALAALTGCPGGTKPGLNKDLDRQTPSTTAPTGR